MKRISVLLIAILFLFVTNVSAEIISKNDEWNTYTDETIGLSIDIPKVLEESLFKKDTDSSNIQFTHKNKISTSIPVSGVGIVVFAPKESSPQSLNDLTNEEFNDSKNFIQTMATPAKVEDIKLDGQRAFMITITPKSDEQDSQVVIVKKIRFIINKQLVFITIIYLPETDTDKLSEQIQNSIRFSK